MGKPDFVLVGEGERRSDFPYRRNRRAAALSAAIAAGAYTITTALLGARSGSGSHYRRGEDNNSTSRDDETKNGRVGSSRGGASGEPFESGRVPRKPDRPPHLLTAECVSAYPFIRDINAAAEFEVREFAPVGFFECRAAVEKVSR